MPTSESNSQIVERALQISDVNEAVEYIKTKCAGDAERTEEVLAFYHTARRLRDAEETVGVGDTVGNYKLLRRLGRGIIAQVYLAEHNIISTNYAAIKIFKKSAISVEGEEIWRRDPALLSRLNHDNVVRFYDAGMTEDKTPYVVMEFVHGSHIDDYCNANQLTVRERLKLFRSLCEVISYIHSEKIAHLDLKPTNILVTPTPNGKLKLIDFGAGKLLQFVAHEGTPPPSRFTIAFTRDYTSPEQINAEYARVNEVSDIYSLGAVLYKLITDHTPLEFDSDSHDEVRRVISNKSPLPPSQRLRLCGEQSVAEISEADSGTGDGLQNGQRLDGISKDRGCQPEQLIGLLKGELDAIVMKCLEKDQNKRYQKVEELKADVDRFLRSLAVTTRLQKWWSKVRRYAALLLGMKTGQPGWPKWRTATLRVAILTLVLLGVAIYVLRTIYRPSAGSGETRLFRVMSVDKISGEPSKIDLGFNVRVQSLAAGTNIELMLIPMPDPPATFMMGSNGEALRDSAEEQQQRVAESPVHEAKVLPFYLGRTEVTQAQWRAVAMMPMVNVELDPEPSDNKESSAPVTNVSYMDAIEFCARLSRATGLNYRLPTEAEWEYACSAGTQTIYGLGYTLTKEVANFDDPKDIKPAGKPLPASRIKVGNQFGLFNMNGNVWEWTQDLWHPNYLNNTHLDEKAWETFMTFPDASGLMVENKDYRVIRGGAFDRMANWCRCTSRTNGTALRQDVGRNGQTGFRVALTASDLGQ